MKTAFFALLLMALPASAAEIAILGKTFDSAALLASPQAKTVHVDDDVAYHRPADYRALPLKALMTLPPNGTLAFRATDGFVAQLPTRLIAKGEPWLAVEDKPWPALPGKSSNAGPFYLIWPGQKVSPEQWPYAIASISLVQSPLERWPQLAAKRGDAKALAGQQLFLANCFACHRLGSAGESEVGPDLGRPMAVSHYLTKSGFKALVRNPKAVRTWPLQQMPAFDEKTLTDKELDALVHYLWENH